MYTKEIGKICPSIAVPIIPSWSLELPHRGSCLGPLRVRSGWAAEKKGSGMAAANKHDIGWRM